MSPMRDPREDTLNTDSKLMDMLTGYSAAHRHPFNVAVHMLGIPGIMFGVLIALSWLGADFGSVSLNLAHLTLVGFVLFYLSLDVVFALVFALFGAVLTVLAGQVAALPLPVSGTVAAVCFFGGYLLQFVGHAVERSMPVLVKHPIQAQLAAPFFTVVELFKILHLREELFDEIQRRIAAAEGRNANA